MKRKIVVYYESIKRELKIKPIYECRCDGRLQTKRFTHLSYTGLVVELEHLKIKTRLANGRLQTKRFTCLAHTGLVVELERLKIKKRLTNEKFTSVCVMDFIMIRLENVIPPGGPNSGTMALAALSHGL